VRKIIKQESRRKNDNSYNMKRKKKKNDSEVKIILDGCTCKSRKAKKRLMLEKCSRMRDRKIN
jgi:hypothetical protein